MDKKKLVKQYLLVKAEEFIQDKDGLVDAWVDFALMTKDEKRTELEAYRASLVAEKEALVTANEQEKIDSTNKLQQEIDEAKALEGQL